MKHKIYDTSKVKTITLNGKKYIDMSVIEKIKNEIRKLPSKMLNGEYIVYRQEVLKAIDQAIKECDTV